MRQCPAYGKICNKCEQMNHFGAMCRSKYFHSDNVRVLNEVDGDNANASDEESSEFI